MSIIKVQDLKVRFGDRVVLNGVNITINRKDIYAILGKSGSGKTTLLRSILMLEKFSGTIEVFGIDLNKAKEEEKQAIRNRYGVMFQAASLFTSLTVGENILASIEERVKLPKRFLNELVNFKLKLVGLESWVANLYPHQLSGGMRKKAALARALALDPEIIFLDEPTSGLDPVSADDFDETIKELNELLGITVVMITHDLDSLFNIAKRACVIREGKILAEGTPFDIMNVEDEWLKEMFNGLRGKKYKWNQK